ncbi:MAG: phosphonoacetaldehyde reductase [Nanoarchaeota archaeon]
MQKIQKEFIGPGCLANLKIILEDENPSSIFLVTGRKSYFESGAQEVLEHILHSYQVTCFSDFSVNPQLEDVKKGISLFRENNSDLVIAVGGGSVIDIAKSINFLAAQQGAPEDYITKKQAAQVKPTSFVAIPTTAGTGSEATHFAVVYIHKTKYSLAHQEWMLPDYVFLDPTLTYNLPKYITASTGIDALCQAMESYWSTQSTEESKEYARQAITIALDNLEGAVNSPAHENREKMMVAANLAGKAINISKTTACHSISYPMTSYFGISHGHACALTLAEMSLYNAEITPDECLDKRGSDYVKAVMQDLCSLFKVKDPQQLQQKVNRLMDQIGLDRRLSHLGIIHPADHGVIVANGFNPERVKNNPRNLTEEALREILKKIS